MKHEESTNFLCLTTGTLTAQEGKVTSLIAKDLPDIPGKEGPECAGALLLHAVIDISSAWMSLRHCPLLEETIHTQFIVRGYSSQNAR